MTECKFNENVECIHETLVDFLTRDTDVLYCANCLRSQILVEIRRLRVTGVQP